MCGVVWCGVVGGWVDGVGGWYVVGVKVPST